MKVLRKEWPRVRQYVKAGNTYYQVDLRRKHHTGQKWKNFTTRTDALKYATDLAGQVATDGLKSIRPPADERVTVWTHQLAVHGKTLEDAVTLALREFQKEAEARVSPYVGELLTVWLDDKKTDPLKPLRPATLKDYRNKAEIFKTRFGRNRIKEITKDAIEEWLKEGEWSNQYRANLRRVFGQFFNWAVQQGHVASNPCEGIEITIPREEPKFFKLDEARMLMAAAKNEPSVTAYFALCLFGGVRPEEAERLSWEEISLETKELSIPASISKTKKARRFGMSDNLHAWLQSVRTVSPLVPQANLKNLRVRVAKAAGVQWIQDGMRHTFASFHYAKHQSLDKLRFIMGNSPAIIERFYRGVIPQDEVDAFWAIQP